LDFLAEVVVSRTGAKRLRGAGVEGLSSPGGRGRRRGDRKGGGGEQREEGEGKGEERAKGGRGGAGLRVRREYLHIALRVPEIRASLS